MSRYTSAEWRPLTNRSTRTVQKDLCCWHTAVSSSLAGTWNYFNTGAGGRGVYSTGMIGGGWGADLRDGLDGVAWQMQDSDLRCAANLDGNWHIIAWETSDNAVRPIQPWTPKQCDKIVEIAVETYYLDDIPLVVVPDSLPGRRGHAYHRLGVDPYRVAGGELWSTAYGKDCPTDPRIAQLPDLIERARRIVAGEEDDVQIADLNDAAAKGQLNPFLDALAARTMTVVRDRAGLATAQQISTAVQQLATRIQAGDTALGTTVTSARDALLGGMASMPTAHLDEADRAELAQDIAERVEALDSDADVEAIAAALAERPLVFGPAPAA